MPTVDDVLSVIDAEQGAALDRLFEFLRIPSISAQAEHYPDCDRAADWLVWEDELAASPFRKPASPSDTWAALSRR